MATKKVWKNVFIFIIVMTIISFLIILLFCRDDILMVLQCFAIFGGAVGLIGLCLGANTFRLNKLTKYCIAHTEGELMSCLQLHAVAGMSVPVNYNFKYNVNGKEYIRGCDDVEGVSPGTPAGTKVDIWYNPDKPEMFFVAADQTLNHDKIIGWWSLGISSVLVILGIIAFISI